MSPARRAAIQQQRVQCLSSDADYTSSSEQSCDTVIYVGKNGRALSDRELTDNEGPPAPPPTPPQPPTSVTPVSSANRPTIAGKLSRVSVASGSSSAVTFPLPYTVTSGPVGLGCVVQTLPEDSCSTYVADSGHGEGLTSMTKSGAEISKLAAECLGAAVKLRKTPTNRRAVAATVGGTLEHWIDGPCTCSAAKHFTNVETASVASVVSADTDVDDAAAAEMWVDGPAEFQKDPDSLVESTHRSPMKLRMSKCAKLYRARAAAIAAAAAATADDASVRDVIARRAVHGDCSGQTTTKDGDVSDLVSAAVRQYSSVDSCQLRHNGSSVVGVTRLLTTTDVDAAEELGRCRARRRSSGRNKQTTHVTLASFYAPEHCPPSAQSSPARRLRPTGGHTTAVRGGVRCGDRTAQWVRSVQAATAAGVAAPPQLSHFARPTSPLKSQSVDRVLRGCVMDRLQRAGVSGLGAWQDDSASDDAITAVSNNSPPPDYATCVAADLDRRRRHSRRLSSPTANLDINENLAASGTSGLPPKLLPVSYIPAAVRMACGWSAPYSCTVAPINSGVETDSRRSTSSCCQQPETVFDSSTWPRRQDGGSLTLATDELVSSPCKRLHHPDGASNPQLSEEVSRVDAVDCCKLLTSLDGDVDLSCAVAAAVTAFSLSTTDHQCCRADVNKFRSSVHSAVDCCETSPASLPCSGVQLTADEDDIARSNTTPRPVECPSSSRRAGDTGPPTANLSKADGLSTRLKASSSSSNKTASSPKRNKCSSSSGMSLLWCIHPRASKSRSTKHRACDGGESTEHVAEHQQQWTAELMRQQPQCGAQQRGTDVDQGSCSLSAAGSSESTATAARDDDLCTAGRPLCTGDDDDSSRSDYWSTKTTSAHHIPSTSQLACSNTITNSILHRHTGGNVISQLHGCHLRSSSCTLDLYWTDTVYTRYQCHHVQEVLSQTL